MELDEIKRKLEEAGLSDKDPQTANLYAILAGIIGQEPEGVVIGVDGTIHLSVKVIADVTELSPKRVQGLVMEGKVDAIRPGGHDLFVSLSSALFYIAEGRMRPWDRSKKARNKK